MHRIEGLHAESGRFKDSPPGTRVTDDWLNAVQEELCGIISAAGLTVASAATDTWGQIWPAVAALAGTPSKGYVAFATPASGGTWWPASYGRALGDKVTIHVVGAGGGGGGASAVQTAHGGGAGGYGLSLHTLSAFNLNSGITITIGSGGAGGASGAFSGINGTTTSFGTYITATGGIGGNKGTVYEYAAGGTCTGANILNNTGSWGMTTVENYVGGCGGNSPFGGGGGLAPRYGQALNGSPGTAPGAGGGGASRTATAQAGGAGANGIVLILW